MKPTPSFLFLRERQRSRGDSLLLLNDHPVEWNGEFFRSIHIRRARWNMSHTFATPDQQSCLDHLSDQFNQGQLASVEISPSVQQFVLESLHSLT